MLMCPNQKVPIVHSLLIIYYILLKKMWISNANDESRTALVKFQVSLIILKLEFIKLYTGK